MKTIMVDGKEVMVDERMTGNQLTELARCSDDQFAVVVRSGNPPQRIPIQKSRHAYTLNDRDAVESMYRVPNGRE